MGELVPHVEYGPLDGKNYECAWKGDFLAAHLLSDVGRKRKNNEDSCIMCAPEDTEIAARRGLLFAVADGMGGALAGEHASRLALQTLVHEYFGDATRSAPEALHHAVGRANAKIFEEAQLNSEFEGMGTTVSSLAILGTWAYIAQVGDSRVYLVRDSSRVHQLTQDHSLVAEQVRNGLISEEEARTHSLRNLITRAVGIKADVQIDSFAVPVKKGNTFLLCSDGLSGHVPDNLIGETLAAADLAIATRKLVDLALQDGGTDNVTTLTLRVTAPPPESQLQNGAQEIDLSQTSFLGRIKSFFG